MTRVCPHLATRSVGTREETLALYNTTGGEKYDFYGYKDTCQVWDSIGM